MSETETAFQELKRLVEEGSIASMGPIPSHVFGIVAPKTKSAPKSHIIPGRKALKKKKEKE